MDFAINLAPPLSTYFRSRFTRGRPKNLSYFQLKDIGLTRFDFRRMNF